MALRALTKRFEASSAPQRSGDRHASLLPGVETVAKTAVLPCSFLCVGIVANIDLMLPCAFVL